MTLILTKRAVLFFHHSSNIIYTLVLRPEAHTRVQPLPHVCEAYHNPTANYYKKYNFYQSQYNISLKSIIHPFTLVMFILSIS